MAKKRAGSVVVDFQAKTASFEKGVHRIERQLNGFSRQMRSTRNLLRGFGGTLAAALSVQAVVAAATTYEKLNASLVTVTGSAKAASQEFARIKEFTASTPFQLQEVTDAFIKMRALGLDPTAETMRSLGNTAAAMGKSLNQIVEAVADAVTGEFERLKEFGIKTRQEGERVTFTFKGVQTTVNKTSEDILGFLREIGANDFAGGMERQMDTLGGKFSNLSDAVWNLSTAFSSESGLNAALKDFIGFITDGINVLNHMISAQSAGDQLLEKITQVQNRIDSLRSDASGSIHSEFFESQIPMWTAQLEALQAAYRHLNATTESGSSSAAAGGGEAAPFAMTESSRGNRAAEDASMAALAAAQAEADGILAIKRSQLIEERAMRATELQDKLDWLDAKFVTETQRIQEQFLFTSETVAEQQAMERAMLAEHEAAKSELIRQHTEENLRTQEQAEEHYLQMKRQTVMQTIGLLGMLAQKNKAFAIAAILLNKAESIQLAIQNTAVGVTKALSSGNIPLAKAIATMGKIQIGIIAATGALQISNAVSGTSGGSTSIGSNGSVSSSFESVQGSLGSGRRTVTINLGDDDGLISKKAVRNLIAQINDEVGDGVRLIGGEAVA